MLNSEQNPEECPSFLGINCARDDDSSNAADNIIMYFKDCFTLSLAVLAINPYLRILLHVNDTAGCKPVVQEQTFADSETTTSLPAPSAVMLRIKHKTI